jgi:hypothetical protein
MNEKEVRREMVERSKDIENIRKRWDKHANTYDE